MNYPQMRFRYIKYKNICIRDNISAVIFFYDNFYKSSLRVFFLPAWLRRIRFFGLKMVIGVAYLSRFYRLRYGTVLLAEDFLVKKEGRGSFGSDVVVIKKKKNDYIIRKRVFSEEAFRKYKEYYDRYFRNQSRIFLPESVFDEENKTATIDFVRAANLSNLINRGILDFDDALDICRKISAEIDSMYSPAGNILIHGDFSIVNLFLRNGRYWLIDYADAFEYEKEYDKYFLFKSLLKYAGLDCDNYDLLNKYFNLSPKKFEEYERIYKERRRLKMDFPEITPCSQRLG